MQAPRGRRYIAPTNSWSPHEIGVSDQRQATAALYTRETNMVPIGLEAEWVSVGLDTEAREKILCFWRDRTPADLSEEPSNR
jgi:hypothetical protein